VKRKRLLLIILLFIAMFPDLDAQCAMCKSAAESSMKNDAGSIARGLNAGILYLMAVPYLMIMFIFRKQLATLFRRFILKRQDDVPVDNS
jgi:hypothetical protein